MAERDEKIYPALPQKRQRAREEGQTANSRDLTGAIVFAGAALLAAGTLTLVGTLVIEAFDRGIAAAAAGQLSVAIAITLFPLALVAIFGSLLALMALLGAGLQGAILFSPTRLVPDLARLNPLSYFGRIFALAGLLELVKAAGKIVLVGLAGWEIAQTAMAAAAGAATVGLRLAALGQAVRRLLGWSAAIALAVAAADYAHKRYQFEGDLRMTRQELLDELKREEGNPQVKRALRRLMRQGFKRIRGIHQAATATVVLTNPTHYAVALRYRRGFDAAPLVVAKGAGESAHRVVAIARLAAVPVQENPLLARALFRGVEVGEQIPRSFYRAVAEVLGMILRADAERRLAVARIG